jgi:hypothetical protein
MHTQFHTHDPSPATYCAATTRHGHPCQGPALEHSLFCAFHDPDHAATVAAGRARGGAAPRRRIRRLPRRLDYLQVAELTGELFVEALNHADPADPRSLRAVSQLARVLLQAVGRPKDTFVPPAEDAEPEADAPHLLRVYQPLTPGIEALLAAETPVPPRPGFAAPARGAAPDFGGHHDYYFQPDYPQEAREQQDAPWLDAIAADPAESLEEFPEAAPALDLTPEAGPASDALPIAAADLALEPAPLNGPRPEPEADPRAEPRCGQRPELGPGQAMDREWTGHLATENYSAADPFPAPHAPAGPADQPRAPASGPAFALPRSLAYIRPRPRDPFG